MSFFDPFGPLDAFTYDELVECAAFALQCPRIGPPSFRPRVDSLPWEWGAMLRIATAYGKMACIRTKTGPWVPAFARPTQPQKSFVLLAAAKLPHRVGGVNPAPARGKLSSLMDNRRV